MFTAWKRPEEWASLVLGVVLLIAPFVLGVTANLAATGAAVVLGILLIATNLYQLARREVGATEWVIAILGVLTFVSPFVMGFTGAVVMAGLTFIIGILVFALAVSLLVRNQRPTAA